MKNQNTNTCKECSNPIDKGEAKKCKNKECRKKICYSCYIKYSKMCKNCKEKNILLFD